MYCTFHMWKRKNRRSAQKSKVMQRFHAKQMFVRPRMIRQNLQSVSMCVCVVWIFCVRLTCLSLSRVHTYCIRHKITYTRSFPSSIALVSNRTKLTWGWILLYLFLCCSHKAISVKWNARTYTHTHSVRSDWGNEAEITTHEEREKEKKI